MAGMDVSGIYSATYSSVSTSYRIYLSVLSGLAVTMDLT